VAAATIRAARALLPGLPHVAVFDTAFHAPLPETAWRYPLPAEWEGWEIRRYGFHGLSVAWSVERAAGLLARPVDGLNLVVAHLGSGCSVTAIAGGRSVQTSMGMTPLEGLMMGTRAGSLDPGILLAVLRDGRRTAAELADDLDHRSGLLGVSGQSAGMRELETAAAEGDARAALAIQMFEERAAAGIAAAATALPRLDALAFTAGIGEHAGRVRARIVSRLAVLGVPPVEPDETGADRILAAAPGRPAVLRVEAREDVVAARSALAVADSRT
jgi:acetate kinase